MRVSTTDPSTLKYVTDPGARRFVIGGRGEGTLEVYLESEATRARYLDDAVEHSGEGFQSNLGNPV